VNTDANMTGREALVARVQSDVGAALSHFAEHLTRVEVHLGDENAGKAGNADKRCMIEARLEGYRPIAVTHHAATVAEALDGAAERMVHRLDHTLGRLQDQRRHGNPVPLEPD
jgi:ribosome-associated translation inhibitor RaiA